MTPETAYRRLNKFLWRNRLPLAKIILVDDTVMPTDHGLTVDDDGDPDFRVPLLFLNTVRQSGKGCTGKTLVHEMLHIAEPQLPHCKSFHSIVDAYWRIARKKIKGLETL